MKVSAISEIQKSSITSSVGYRKMQIRQTELVAVPSHTKLRGFNGLLDRLTKSFFFFSAWLKLLPEKRTCDYKLRRRLGREKMADCRIHMQCQRKLTIKQSKGGELDRDVISVTCVYKL